MFGNLFKANEKKVTKKGSKTAKKKNGSRSKNGANDNTTSTLDESRETKQRASGVQYRRRDNKGSKEQASTAAASSKKQKAKTTNKQKKNLSKGKHNTTEEVANQLLKDCGCARQRFQKSQTPPTPDQHKGSNNLTFCEDECPATVGALCNPPDFKRVPGNVEQGSAKPKLREQSIKANSAATTHSTLSTTDWHSIEVAKAWLENKEFENVRHEFDSIPMAAVDVVKECKKWKAYEKLNQSTYHPALDSKLVDCENGYVNMTKIELPDLHSLILGQLPVKGNEEAFWKTVFEKRIVTMIVILGDTNETFNTFPAGVGDHTNFGTMFVHNRRVENIAEENIYRFAIEVLADGCSNSIICNITVISKWMQKSVPSKYNIIVKECIDILNCLISIKDDNIAILSQNGAGRPGFVAALMVAIHKIDKLLRKPSIIEIVKGIRVQRPMAVESNAQYISLYITLFYFIKKKISKNEAIDKKDSKNKKESNDKKECNDPTFKKAAHLQESYEIAMAEQEAQATQGQSTMTMIKQ